MYTSAVTPSSRSTRSAASWARKWWRPPRLATSKHCGGRGKSDPIDALAVAHAVLRYPDLPVAAHDETSRELKLLVDRREDLVTQRTSTINRLRQRVHELDPAAEPKPASLHREWPRAQLRQWLDTQRGLLAELAGDELTEITRLTETIDALAARIGDRVHRATPAPLALPGCGELTAAKLFAEPAGVTRFKSQAAFARHSGVAPIPVWSGNTAGRVRLTRSGDRQLNADYATPHQDHQPTAA